VLGEKRSTSCQKMVYQDGVRKEPKKKGETPTFKRVRERLIRERENSPLQREGKRKTGRPGGGAGEGQILLSVPERQGRFVENLALGERRNGKWAWVNRNTTKKL